MSINLTRHQIENLARPILGMLDEIEKYYENPENEKRFREWYKEKYGHEPNDEVSKK